MIFQVSGNPVIASAVCYNAMHLLNESWIFLAVRQLVSVCLLSSVPKGDFSWNEGVRQMTYAMQHSSKWNENTSSLLPPRCSRDIATNVITISCYLHHRQHCNCTAGKYQALQISASLSLSGLRQGEHSPLSSPHQIPRFFQTLQVTST